MKIQNNDTMPNALDGSWHAGKVTSAPTGTFSITIKNGNFVGKCFFAVNVETGGENAFFVSVNSGTYYSASNTTEFLGIGFDDGGIAAANQKISLLVFIPKVKIPTSTSDSMTIIP